MNRLTKLVGLAAIQISIATGLHGQVLIESTLGLAPNNSPALTSSYNSGTGNMVWAGMGFTTGSQAYSLTSMVVNMRLESGTQGTGITPPYPVTIQIYTADTNYYPTSGTPTAALQPTSTVTGSYSPITFNSVIPQGQTLSANTRYVAVMQATPGINESRIYDWGWSSSAYSATNGWVVPNSVSYLSPAPGGTWATANNYTALASFTGTAIPEPSTYAALFGVAAMGFVAWRRRKV